LLEDGIIEMLSFVDADSFCLSATTTVSFIDSSFGVTRTVASFSTLNTYRSTFFVALYDSSMLSTQV